MTTYGTIPTSSSTTTTTRLTNLDYISRATHSLYSTRRPWRQLFSSFTLPHSFNEATTHVRANLAYFSVNYAMIVLGIVFLSLLWHPISLIVLIVMLGLWIVFYFYRDEPVVVFGKVVGENVVLGILGVLTIGVLLFTKAVANVVVSLVVGVVLVVVHAAVKGTEDLNRDEEAGEVFVR